MRADVHIGADGRPIDQVRGTFDNISESGIGRVVEGKQRSRNGGRGTGNRDRRLGRRSKTARPLRVLPLRSRPAPTEM